MATKPGEVMALSTTSQSEPNGRSSKDVFPFIELPVELRIMIYKASLSYDSIHDVAQKIANLPKSPRHLKWCEKRLRHKYYLRKNGEWTPRYNLCTPTILLLNRKTYSEAIYELRKLLLDLSGIVNSVLYSCELELLDFISINTLRTISHIYVGANSEFRAMHILWRGLRLYEESRDIPSCQRIAGALISEDEWQLKILSKDCKQSRQMMSLSVQEKALKIALKMRKGVYHKQYELTDPHTLEGVCGPFWKSDSDISICKSTVDENAQFKAVEEVEEEIYKCYFETLYSKGYENAQLELLRMLI